jgi:hypothetical protein
MPTYIFLRARIWPLIKFSEEKIIPGAYWKKAENKEDTFRKWESAAQEEATNRLF